MLNKDKDYHSYSSLLSFIQDGPKSLIEERKKSSKGLSKGKALDIYMYDDFDSKYYVSDVNVRLTSMESKFLDLVRKETVGTLSDERIESDEFEEVCNDIAKDNDLFKGDFKTTEGIKERIKNIKIILKDEIRSEGKTIIDGSFYMDIVNMANKLRKDKAVSKYFNNQNIDQYQNLNQIKMMFTYDNKKFKTIIDNIHIDHINKTLQINDLKFTSLIGNDFMKSFYKYRYDIQLLLYCFAIKHFRDENPEFSKYSIIEPTIITVNTTEAPRMYLFKSYDLYGTWIGFEDVFGKYHQGVMEYISDIEFHVKNNLYEYDRTYYTRGMETIYTGRRSDGDLRFMRPAAANPLYKISKPKEALNVDDVPGVLKEAGLEEDFYFDTSINEIKEFKIKESVTKKSSYKPNKKSGYDKHMFDLMRKQINNKIDGSKGK